MKSKTCPICAENGEFAFTSRHGFDVYGCKNSACSHFWLPLRKPGQGVHERMSSLDVESDRNLREYERRNERLLKILLEKIQWNNSDRLEICDFGAGCAHVARTFKKELKDKAAIYCIEANSQASKFYPNWDLEVIDNIQDIPAGTIDLVYAIEVLEHLDDPEKVVRQMGRTLKPGGKLFITTPEGWHNERETNAYDNPAHVHFFTDASLNMLLGKCGLSPLERIDRHVMYPRPEDAVLRVRLRLKLMRMLSRLKKIIIKPAFAQESVSASAISGVVQAKNQSSRKYHLVGFTAKVI